MGKRKTQQFVGRGKEAQVAAVGSSSVKPNQEQLHAEQSEPELTRCREILQTFDKTLQRWRANVCIPENCELDRKQNPQNGREVISEWSYCIGYPPTTPPRIIPKGFYKGGKEDVSVYVVLASGGLLDNFAFDASNFENEALKDPYTNEGISSLTVLLRGYYQSASSLSRPKPYDFIIVERTQTKKKRGLEYRVRYPNEQLHIEIGEVHQSDMFVSGGNEVLSEPHALELFNLMDKLIPSVTPIITYQPTRRASTEIPAPKALPPVRRTPRG